MHFVLERWCHQWYMARVLEQEEDDSATPSLGSEQDQQQPDDSTIELSQQPRLIRVHALGDSIAADKTFPIDSPNIIFIEILLQEHQRSQQRKQQRQQEFNHQPVDHLFNPHGGEFPTKHDFVEIYIADKPLAPLLRARKVFLVGQVVRVLPSHDASLVDVMYPLNYHVTQRKIHINNGYIRIISEHEFRDKCQRLQNLDIALASQ